MEINDSVIARLVLGYLKRVKCSDGFYEFLTKSEHLKSHAVFVKNGIYFATRLGGLTLEDILREYSVISMIIQVALENTTDYYQKQLKLSLTDQLKYILGDSYIAEPSLSKDLNATPVESLPGNLSNDDPKSRTPSCIRRESEISIIVSSSTQTDRKSLVDLDNQITAMRQKPDKDPAFDKLLEEIIGDKSEKSAQNSISNNESGKTHAIVDESALILPLNVETGSGTPVKNASLPENSTVKATPQAGQIFLTNNGLLMVPSNYLFVNTPQTKPASNSVISETDIMKMPLLVEETPKDTGAIVQEPPPQSKQLSVITQSQIIVTSSPQVMSTSQNATTTLSSKKSLKTIAPKTDKITIASQDGNYYKVLYQEPPSPVEKPRGRPGLRARASSSNNKNEKPKKKTPSPLKKKSAKSLFKDNKKNVWDAELRKLLKPKDSSPEDVSITDEQLKREAMLIEEAFRTPVKEKPKEGESPNVEVTESTHSVKSDEQEEVIITEETEMYLRNCNGPARIKKKCNLTSPPQKFQVVEVVEMEESPTVETPLKREVPKTPGAKIELTPFSKALEEQLAGMDLLALPTPTFPITPGTNLTPEHHSNRPTDYSTSSSYYQPSDSEQTKSMEAVMEELRNNAKKKTNKSENVTELKEMFNKNVIGKKNLNLIKKESSGSEEGDSDSFSSSTDTETSSESDFETRAKLSPTGPYSFRKRIPKKEEATKPASTKKNVRKTVAPKKKETKNNEADKCDNENEITDDDFALHLSTDEDSTNNKTNTEAPTVSQRKEGSCSENAKQLIQDLYDRGIHLLPKVQDTKTSPVNPNALENLDVSSEDNSMDLEEAPVMSHKLYGVEDQIQIIHQSNEKRKKKEYDMSQLKKKMLIDSYSTTLKKDILLTLSLSSRQPKVHISKKAPTKREKRFKSTSNTDKPKNEKATTKRVRSRSTNERNNVVSKTVQQDDTISEPPKSGEVQNEKVDGAIGTSSYDDLMNFAVLGENTEEQDKNSDVKSGEKRKHSLEEENNPPEKKTKTETEKQNLLKKVNVDLFLNKVHGSTMQSK